MAFFSFRAAFSFSEPFKLIHYPLLANGMNAFCCHDIAEKGGDWDPDTVLTAMELHDLVAPLPCRVEVWLDTCHSGGGLRELGRTYGRSKFLPHPAARGEDGGPAPVLAPQYTTPANAVLWAVCGKGQTAADGGPAGGVFTQSFLRAYQAGESRHHEIIAVKQLVRQVGYGHQEPLLQCTTALALQAVGL